MRGIAGGSSIKCGVEECEHRVTSEVQVYESRTQCQKLINAGVHLCEPAKTTEKK